MFPEIDTTIFTDKATTFFGELSPVILLVLGVIFAIILISAIVSSIGGKDNDFYEEEEPENKYEGDDFDGFYY